MKRLFAIVYDWFLWQCRFAGNFSRMTFDPKEVERLAVALQRTSPCTAHAGIAYRTAGGALRFLHFASHELLRDDDPSVGKYSYSMPLIKEEDLDFLAAFCGRVYRANQSRKLPYSFEFDPDLNFSRDTGLVTSNIGSGFTCSTFVVAFFRSAGNPLVRTITWPGQADSSDVAARQYVLDMWRQLGITKLLAQANKIEPTIRTMRISPEQVSGACLQNRLPVGYRCASENGRRILDCIAAKFGPP